jgi:hypothetical protein
MMKSPFDAAQCLVSLYGMKEQGANRLQALFRRSVFRRSGVRDQASGDRNQGSGDRKITGGKAAVCSRGLLTSVSCFPGSRWHPRSPRCPNLKIIYPASRRHREVAGVK